MHRPVAFLPRCVGKWRRPASGVSAAAAAKAPVAAPSAADVERWNRLAYVPGRFTVPSPAQVPDHIPRPSYAKTGFPRQLDESEYAQVKNAKEIEGMRNAGRLAAQGLAMAGELAAPGITTDEVDRRVTEFVLSQGAYPVGINYYGFPRSICASPNEVVVHGIPNTRPLENGDIVNFDVTVYLDGYFGDCSKTFCIGHVDRPVQNLVDTTELAVSSVIQHIVGPGQRLSAIGLFINEFAKERGFSVVKEFCGHFIGTELHMRPNVLHVPNDDHLVLRPGMTFTIEPILVEGSPVIEGPKDDGWTYVSKDRSWSAQHEHTVVVTENGCDIITLP